MMKSTINLDIARKRGVGRVTRNDPVKNSAFQALCIIRSCTRYTFLKLWKTFTVTRYIYLNVNTYQFSHHHDIVVSSVKEAFLEARYHLKELSKYPMLSPLPAGRHQERKAETEGKDVLSGKKFVWLLRQFTKAQNAIGEESFNIT
jgi:hypothetical protein